MTRENISQVIGNVSDRHIEEAMNYERKGYGFSWLKFGTIAACFCLCALIGFGVWQGGVFGKDDKTIGGDKTADGGVIAGSDAQGIKFSNTAVKTRGTRYTDDEIQRYLNENSDFIVTAMQREYSFPINSISVYKKGVNHVSLDDNTVILDAVTLPILVNGKIYGVVDMVRAEDGIVSTIGLGGDKWENYNKVLFDETNTDVVFAYLPDGCGEIMLFPDNTFVDPRVGAVRSSANVFGKDVNWYDLLKTEDNTLSAVDLMNSDNIVTLYQN